MSLDFKLISTVCAFPVRLSFELPQESAWSCGFFLVFGGLG